MRPIVRLSFIPPKHTSSSRSIQRNNYSTHTSERTPLFAWKKKKIRSNHETIAIPLCCGHCHRLLPRLHNTNGIFLHNGSEFEFGCHATMDHDARRTTARGERFVSNFFSCDRYNIPRVVARKKNIRCLVGVFLFCFVWVKDSGQPPNERMNQKLWISPQHNSIFLFLFH